jgi:formate hydrogenlyase transcriptional activator
LRERPDDIPTLAEHFVRKFADRMNSQVNHIPEDVMDILRSHNWPGNIRELQNVIERAVIISTGSNLRLPFGELKRPAITTEAAPSAVRTLADAERHHILETLHQVGWVVGGKNGAAARLGVPRTTLVFRMRKLGISQQRSVPAGRVASEWADFGNTARVPDAPARKPLERVWLS